MSIKRGSPEGAYGRFASQDLHDMARAKLLKPQCPVMLCSFLVNRTYCTRPATYLPFQLRGNVIDRVYHHIGMLSVAGRRELTRSRTRTRSLSHATTSSMRKRGIAYGPRGLWRRSLHSSRGEHDVICNKATSDSKHRGIPTPLQRTGKPSTGRREAGVQAYRGWRYAQCRTLTQS